MKSEFKEKFKCEKQTFIWNCWGKDVEQGKINRRSFLINSFLPSALVQHPPKRNNHTYTIYTIKRELLAFMKESSICQIRQNIIPTLGLLITGG
ncbi:hypothetical protein DRO34_06845 [Candidatus Bathyarchaeota archaeon]|nr:MAG: hypothetical protein DRO34_06845 [Candidatus Bathyarchaeota archaeon]